jgi:hypothetical protein
MIFFTRVSSPRKLALLGLLIFSAIFFGCITNNDDDKNKCDDTAQPLIEPYFRIHFQVHYENGTPFTGRVYYFIEKHYCNGTISGHYLDSAQTTSNGYWKPITTEYKLANDSDFVYFEFSTSTYPLDYFLYYQTVDNEMFYDQYENHMVFEDTFEVILSNP